MTDLEFSPVAPDATFASVSKPYIAAPVNKLLKFHVVELEQTEQLGKYEKNPDGSDNPNFGKPQPVLVFKAMLDEGDAKGQIYSKWITGYYQDNDKNKPAYSFGPRSTFGPIAEALAGSVEAFRELKAADIIGLPFQCSLEKSKKDAEKQVLNTTKIMPASDDQARVLAVEEAIDLDQQAEDSLMDAANAVFDGAEEVK